MKLVNAKKMVSDAFKGGYAIPHININNLEWTKATLRAAQEYNSPLIMATSEGAVKYMGGYKTVSAMVSALMEYMKITIPVALHLDHGSYGGAKLAIESGYTSVMYDGSHESFETNYKRTKEIVALAKKSNISVEAEVGTIGGEEDGIVGNGDIADPKECKLMIDAGVDFLAAGIGNIHGPYPEEWKTLDFKVLKIIKETIQKGIVLHGGSGIPKEQISKAISLGVAKININTELQLANVAAIEEFVISGESKKGKNYDPRKLLASGVLAMEAIVKQKIEELGSKNKG